jgi:3-deoxy-D-manno-octulosonate 8-phosphate phosphatase (KDO 8-P phosphatase)
MLGIKYCYVGDEDKAIVLEGWLKKLNIDFENVAFVGDDVNDSSIIKKVGLSACPSDAVDAIKSLVDIVLTKTGGEACVREFIEDQLADIS